MRSSRTNSGPRCAILAVAGLVLVVAATVMPWATHRDVATGVTTAFRGGALGLLLVIFGLGTIAPLPILITRSSPPLYRLPLACGSAALLVSILVALKEISAANHVTQTGPSVTSYAFGAGVAIVAAIVIALTSLIELANAQGREPSLA